MDLAALRLALSRLREVDSGQWDVEEQVARFGLMSGAGRDRAIRRVLALEPLATGRTGGRRVSELTEELGMGRRNVYVLLERLRRMPPADAVAVDRRGASTSASIGEGSDPRSAVIDAAVVATLEADPVAPLAEVVREVRRASLAAGHRPPAAKTVSRRLDALRSSGRDGRLVGRRILVDECPVKVAVSFGDRLAAQSLALVIDVDSAMVLGWGMASIGRGFIGIGGAISSFSRWSANVASVRQVAPALETLEVVLPKDDAAVLPQELAADFGVIRGGPRSRGVRMRRLMGPEVAGITLLPRYDRSREWLDPDAASDWVVLDRRSLYPILQRQLMPWAMQVVKRTGGPGHDALDEAVARLSRLGRVIDPLRTAALPAMAVSRGL